MLELSALFELPAKLLASPRDLVLVGLLVVAAAMDWRTYKIPNWLTAGGMVFGLIYNAASAASWHTGLLTAFEGLGTGLMLLLPLYALRVMGAGDVKLMAMAGAFLGWPEILGALLFSLIAGGAAALVFAVHRRAVRRLAGNVAHVVHSIAFAAAAGFRPAQPLAGRESVGRFPYGASVALGTTAWLCVRQLGYL